MIDPHSFVVPSGVGLVLGWIRALFRWKASKSQELLSKLDWLIDYHSPKYSLGRVTNAGTIVRASLYVDDLLAAKLVHPLLSEKTKNRNSAGNYIETEVLDHLPVIRERLAHRGLKDARRTVEEWEVWVPVDNSELPVTS